MASTVEKGGNPGIERRPEWPPKKQRDEEALRRALGKTAIDGAGKKG